MRIVPRTDKLQRFFALSGPDKLMLLHAAVWLALARLMLVLLPFNKLAARLPGEQRSGTGDPEVSVHDYVEGRGTTSSMVSV